MQQSLIPTNPVSFGVFRQETKHKLPHLSVNINVHVIIYMIRQHLLVKVNSD